MAGDLRLSRRTVLELELVPTATSNVDEGSFSSSSSLKSSTSANKRKLPFAGRPQQHCSVQVVLHLPQTDLSLWNVPSRSFSAEAEGKEDDDEKNERKKEAVRERQGELMRVLAEQVLPQVFGETELDQVLSTTQSGKRPRRPRRRKGQARKGDAKSFRNDKEEEENVHLATTKQASSPNLMEEESPGGADVRFAFGETIQLQYRVESPRSAASATLLFPPLAKNEDEEEILFGNVHTLPQRIVAWCYPLDSSNPTEPVGAAAASGRNTHNQTQKEGFHRPDFVPLAQLFKSS